MGHPRSLKIIVEPSTCDRQTDGRTQDVSIYRASIASRGKNGSCGRDRARSKGDLLFLCWNLM